MLEHVAEDDHVECILHRAKEIRSVDRVDLRVEVTVIRSDVLGERFNTFDVDGPGVRGHAPVPNVAELAHDHAPATEAHSHVEDTLGRDLHQRLDAEGNVLPIARPHPTGPD